MQTRISINKQVSFEAAHRLRLHKGKCKSLHGHTYKLIVSAEQDPSYSGAHRREETGMVADFGVLSKVIKQVIFEGFVFIAGSKFAPTISVPFDHAIILNAKDPLTSVLEHSDCAKDLNLCKLLFEPTAENMAILLMRRFQDGLFNYERKDILITKISLWETETNFAIVEAKDIEIKNTKIRDIGGEIV